jgi:hypothetical protein
MHEVADGEFYHQQTESVPEQTWSSAGLLSATVHGLLGIHVDSISNHLIFAPHVPPEWKSMSVQNVRNGKSVLGIKLSVETDGMELVIANQGDPVKITFDPEIPLGASAISAECDNRVVKAAPEINAQDEHARIEFTAASGGGQCRIHYRGGVTILAPRTVPQAGDKSRGIKITDVQLAGHSLTVGADIDQAGPQYIEVQTPWMPLSANGGKITRENASLCRVDFDAPAASDRDGYSHRSVTISFREK